MEAATQTVLRVTARLYQRIMAHIILILGFFGLVYFLVYFTVNSGYARRIFDDLFNSQIRGAVQFGRVTWGPLPWKLRVYDVRLVGPRGEPVITAEAVYVRNIHLLAFFAGEIYAEDILLDGVNLDLRAEVKPGILDEMGAPRVVFNIEEMWWPIEGPSEEDGTVGSSPHLIFESAKILEAHAIISGPGYFIEGEHVRVTNGRFEIDPKLDDGMSIGANVVRIASGRVRVDLDDVPGGQKLLIPYEGFEGRHFRWVESVFGLADIKLTTRGDPVRIKPFRMDLNEPDVPSMTATINANIADVSTHLGPLGVEGVEGPAKISGSASGDVDALEANFDVAGTDLTAFGMKIQRWSVTGRKAPEDKIRVDGFVLEAYQATLTGRAEFDPMVGSLYAAGDYTNVDLGRLPLALGRPILDLGGGPIDGRFDFRGTELFDETRRFSAWTKARLTRNGPPLYGLGRVADVEVLANYKAGVLDVRNGTVEIDGDRFTARGQLDPDNDTVKLDGRFAVAQVKPAAAAFGVDVSGRASGRYSVRGALSNPRVEIDFGGKDIRYQNYPAADLLGRVIIDGGRVRFEEVVARTGAGSASVSGGINGDRLDLHVDARQFDITSLPLDLAVGGIASAKVDIGGTTRRPKITIRGRVDRPRYRGLIFDRLDIDGTVSGDRISIQRLDLHDRQRRLLAASGDVDLNKGSYAGKIEVDRVSLGLLESFTDTPLPVTGSVSVALEGEGTFAQPAGGGTVTVHDLAYGDLKLGDAALKVTAGEGRVAVTGDLFGDFAVDAKIPLTEDGGLTTGRVTFTGLSLDRYVEALRNADLETRFSGAVDVEADLFAGRLERVTVNLDEAQASFRYRDASGLAVPPPNQPTCVNCPTVVMANDGPIKLTYEGGVVTLDQVAFKAADQRITATGTLRDDGLLDIMVDGGLDLAVAQPFLASVFTGVEGRGSVSLQLNGFVDDPTFFGAIEIEQMLLLPRSPTVGSEIRLLAPVQFQVVPPYGPMALPEGGEAPPRGVFSLSLPPTRAAKNGAPKDNPGSSAGDGDAEQVPNRFRLWRDDAEIVITRVGVFFQDFAPQSLLVSLDGSAVGINVPQMLRATVNLLDVRFEMWTQEMRRARPETRLRVSGEINILQGEYTADIQSASQINQGFRDNLLGQRRSGSVSVFERVPLLKRLMVDVRLGAENDMLVKNQVTVLEMDLEVRLQLALKGFLYSQPQDAPEDALRIAGFIEALEDSKIVYGRRDFEVLSGRVVMGSGNPQDLNTRGDFLSGDVEASHTFRLRTDQGIRSGNFARGTAGDVRLEEVTLNASVRMATQDSDPDINLSFSSNSGASQIDVATLVLTGSYPSDLTGAASAQPATEVLLGPLLNLIERPLEETLEIDLTLTPASTGTLFIDADKLLSTRLRLYTSTPVGNDDPTNPQTFGLEYRINNITYTDLTNQQFANLNSTTGRLRLRLSFD